MRALLFILATALWQSAAPQQGVDPSALANKDQHQGFLVAAVPYSDVSAAKEKLDKVDAIRAGVLPVEVYLRNTTSEPVHVDLKTIRLDIDVPNGQRLHLQSMTLEQAASEIAHPKGASAPTARRFPPIIPVPIHDSKEDEISGKLQPLMFQTDIVAPGATVRGFLFFDLNHNFDLVPFSTLYVPDVKSITSSQPMIFFEVALKPKASN
ncbi:MAG TPA: hypothetical protein VJN21_00735 [Candidatus Acidoferrales bacterium]|nr:hypothetical protein [Candidatus Acidoferrales bacterium]